MVTDSTAYLPAEVQAECGVTVIPLWVSVAGRSGAEGTEVTPAAVVRALSLRRGPVHTSRPTPEAFGEAFRRLLDGGAGGVVSVHLSSRLSGTWESARLAAAECGGDAVVRVVDSRSTGMGLGFAVIAAARAARAGGSLAEVSAAAARTAALTTSLFYVDTLEHLRRGGRIGAAQALVGTALAVKPILLIRDGEIVLAEKVRTTSRGIARLEALALAAAGTAPVDIAVQHLAALERATALAQRLVAAAPGVRHCYATEVGAAVGAHTGPGLLGVAVAPC